MTSKSICILGGGLSGLTLAYRLNEWRKKNDPALKITLLESSNRLGGILETDERDGFLLERGPDAFFTEKPWAVDLCRELDLIEELIPLQSQHAGSQIYTGKKLHQTPAGLRLFSPTNLLAFVFSPLIGMKTKLGLLNELRMQPRKIAEDENLASFIKRHFGTELYEKIGQPMTGGIYSGDPEQLSARALFPKLVLLEETHGSLIRGLKKSASSRKAKGPRYELFMALKPGMGRLTEKLTEKLDGVDIRVGFKTTQIRKKASWEIISTDQTVTADKLCLATPAPISASLLESFPEIQSLLTEIPYESAWVTNFAYRSNQFSKQPRGFGFVVSKTEEKHLIGCSVSSNKFGGRAPEGHVLLRAFAGGSFGHTFMTLSSEEQIKRITNELTDILSINGEPIFVESRAYQNAMPQYTTGHINRVQKLNHEIDQHPDLTLTGNYLSGVGIPDTIFEASKTAEQIIHSVTNSKVSGINA